MHLGSLSGVIPATVLPMTADAEPDLHAYGRYLKWIVAQGPLALAVNADTGEGPLLSTEERRSVLDAALDAVGDRTPIVSGVSAQSTREACLVAREAQDAGASGLLVFPPPAFLGSPLPPELPYAYHAAIADASDLPMILFQLQPALGGVLFDADALERLVSIPSVVALKEASFDALRFVQTRDLLAEIRPITLLTGNDNFILESLVLGASGALVGMAAIATAEFVDLVQAQGAGDHERAAALSKRLAPLVRATFESPVRNYRARIKEGLVMQGLLSDATVRPPLVRVSMHEREGIRKALDDLGILSGAAA